MLLHTLSINTREIIADHFTLSLIDRSAGKEAIVQAHSGDINVRHVHFQIVFLSEQLFGSKPSFYPESFFINWIHCLEEAMLTV